MSDQMNCMSPSSGFRSVQLQTCKMESLDELSDEPGSTGTKAAGFLAKMETFECFSGFEFAHKVFVVTEQLATALQGKQITLTAAKTSAVNVV